MPRLPLNTDFPDHVKLTIVPPPNGDAATNVLVLLHGLGDSHDSFTRLGEQMKLPQTACISIRGPQPLLDLGGFHWGDDIIFSSDDGGLDADAGFKKSTELLSDVIPDALIRNCGYKPREIILFGFGQGGMAALTCAVEIHRTAQDPSAAELGGVISIGAALSEHSPASLNPKCKTPVLVCAGSSATSSVTSTSEDKLTRVFDYVEVKRYRRSGDSMPASRDEMLPVMQFFSRRLKSTKGVPAGSVEIG